jgi:hypothetical protein
VFTARYALSPYVKQIRFIFKGLVEGLSDDDDDDDDELKCSRELVLTLFTLCPVVRQPVEIIIIFFLFLWSICRSPSSIISIVTKLGA